MEILKPRNVRTRKTFKVGISLCWMNYAFWLDRSYFHFTYLWHYPVYTLILFVKEYHDEVDLILPSSSIVREFSRCRYCCYYLSSALHEFYRHHVHNTYFNPTVEYRSRVANGRLIRTTDVTFSISVVSDWIRLPTLGSWAITI
jgi:hypothetical protein